MLPSLLTVAAGVADEDFSCSVYVPQDVKLVFGTGDKKMQNIFDVTRYGMLINQETIH
jgi:hypothetical protein